MAKLQKYFPILFLSQAPLRATPTVILSVLLLADVSKEAVGISARSTMGADANGA